MQGILEQETKANVIEESTKDKLVQAIEQLNRLTRTLVEQVNAIHSTGYASDGSTAIDFFDPNFTDAATTVEALQEAIAQGLQRITSSDARGYFVSCGFQFLDQSS